MRSLLKANCRDRADDSAERLESSRILQFISFAMVASSNFLAGILLISESRLIDFGVYALLLSIQGLFSGVLSAVIGSNLLYRVVGNNNISRRFAVSLIKLSGFFVCIFAVAGGFLVYVFLDNLSLALMGCLNFAMFTITWVSRSCLIARFKNAYVLVHDVLFSLIYFLITLSISLAATLNLKQVLLSQIVGYVLSILVFIRLLLNRRRQPVKLFDTLLDSKLSLRLTMFPLLGVFSSYVTQSLFIYVVALATNERLFAFVAFINALFRIIQIKVESDTVYRLPKLRKLLNDSKHTLVLRSIKRNMIAGTYICTVNLCLILLLYSQIQTWILKKFGSFEHGVLIICIIAAGKIAFVLRSTISLLFRAQARNRELGTITFFSCLVSAITVIFGANSDSVYWMLIGPMIGEITLITLLIMTYRIRVNAKRF